MDENEWSLGYLTIVGAYVLKGIHHDVATLPAGSRMHCFCHAA